ncbi:hypothetical protein CEXT_405361 [Caerostris extrusa]|uniref:Uncharacterized protein n=1 Tax=Caerostris extrusa TaxID=172846 RepID=A0AAV4S592_CAEEX|nr:hypothetical protein CEXT_405361 [Caerostris extrusa]
MLVLHRCNAGNASGATAAADDDDVRGIEKKYFQKVISRNLFYVKNSREHFTFHNSARVLHHFKKTNTARCPQIPRDNKFVSCASGTICGKRPRRRRRRRPLFPESPQDLEFRLFFRIRE